MDKKFFSNFFEPNIRPFLLVLTVFVTVSAFYNVVVFWSELIILIAVYIAYFITSRIRQKRLVGYMRTLVNQMDSAAKSSLLNFPLPMAIINLNGDIVWYNEKFSDLAADRQYLFERPLNEILWDFDLRALLNSKGEDTPLPARIDNKRYDVYYTAMRDEKQNTQTNLVTIYLVDRTRLHDLETQLEQKRSVVGLIVVDNYEETIQGLKDAEKSNILALVDDILSNWANENRALLQRFERDKYLLIMEESNFNIVAEGRFAILDSIKDIMAPDNKGPVTLSIGIGKGAENFIEGYEFARAAKEIALGRGGDQAAVKNVHDFEFFGGKSKEIEKRTKVKSRVVATALKELIMDCDNVIIMGHKYADIDSVGASAGIFRIATNFGKQAKIVINNRSAMVNRVILRLQNISDYSDAFVSTASVNSFVTAHTLLVILDVHRPEYVEIPELLERCEHIVVIDHHRRGTEFIENTSLVFHEPYASSTCELITEILQYLDDSGKILREEADAILGGIFLDTKNFVIKSGVRTFEAASFLRRWGADTIEAKRFSENDLLSYKDKMSIIAQADIFKGNIAISVYDNSSGTVTKETISQVADELLGISGIDASFIISNFEDEIHISARSYGNINVQMVMEKLGGGGHQTVAGAKIKGNTLIQTRKLLEDAIEEVVKNEE